MKIYRALSEPRDYFERQADVPRGVKFETVEFDFSASPKGDFVAWLNAAPPPAPAPDTAPSAPPTPANGGGLSLAFDDAFEAMPLARQLHFAALAMENARDRVGLAGLSSDMGRRAAGAGPSLTPEQWAAVRQRLVSDYLDVPAVSPEGVALAAIIREICAHYPAAGGSQ